MTTIARLLVILSLGLVLLGCGETPSTEAATSPEPTYDLEAIMRGFAETCRTENEVLAKAIRSWDSIDDEDRRNYWSALQVRVRLGDEWKAMLRAHPSWAETSCQWYESVVETLNMKGVRMWNQLGDLDTPDARTPDGRRKIFVLLDEAAGSREAFKASRHFSLTEIYVLCRESGFIEDPRLRREE